MRSTRLRVHARLHLAARRRAIPAARRDAGDGPAPARGVVGDAAAREQPPRAAPRPPAAPDRRHRHHPARDVQRARRARAATASTTTPAPSWSRSTPTALSGSADTKRLVSTYLAFLHAAQTPEGRFRNFMTYGRVVHGARTAPESDDCTGRALWALGTTAHLSRDEGQRLLARQMFERGLPHATELGPRGTALTMLGLTAFLARHPEVGARRRAPGAARGPAVPAIPARGDRRLALVRARLDLRQRASAARAVARARAHAGSGEPRRRARVAGLSRGGLLPGRSPRPGRERGLARRAAGRAPTPTSSRSTPRRSCSRSGARTS